MIRPPRSALLLVALLLAGPARAEPQAATAAPGAPFSGQADGAVAAPGPRLELTLLGGRRAGGLLRVDTGSQVPLDVADAGAVGGRLAWRLGPLLSLQAEYSRQATELLRRRPEQPPQPVADVTIEYFQAGLRVRLSRRARHPYLSLGVGPMRLRSRDTGESDIFPSLSVGPGVILPLSPHLALTGDLRFFASLVGEGTAVPCQRPEAACLRTGNDTVLLQLHALGGLTVRF